MDNYMKYSNQNIVYEEQTYWKHVIAGMEDEEEVIPRDFYGRPFSGKSVSRLISADMNRDYNVFFQNKPMLKFVVAASAVKTMLSLLYNSKDTETWTPVISDASGADNDFVVLLDRLQDEDRLKDVLNRVKHTVTEAYKNQHVNVLELYNRGECQRENHIGITYHLIHGEDKIKKLKEFCSLVFCFQEQAGNLELQIQFDEASYHEDTVSSIADVLLQILTKMLYDRQTLLKDMELCGENGFGLPVSGEPLDYPEKSNIVDVFAEKVKQFSERTAVVFGEKQLSYQELDQASSKLAGYLMEKTSQWESDYIGIFMDKSDGMITAALAVLKAGKAYIPINLDYPAVKQKEIIEDAGIAILITHKKLIGEANQLQWQCEQLRCFVCIDSEDVLHETEAKKNDLMSKEVWEYVAKQAANQIAQGAWNSSYTNEEISVEEMEEYSENILKKLMPYLKEDTRVLEIGCASGLTMYKIAPHAAVYYGTDLSENTILADERYNKEHHITNITLKVLPADRIDEVAGEFDIIIMNSVAQCFDGHNYFRKVMEKAAAKISGEGIIFVGDIMDPARKQDLIDSLTAYKMSHKEANTKLNWDQELFLDKRFLTDLAVDLREVKSVEFSDKIHTIPNELTRFRYDAVFYIDKHDQADRTREVKHKFQDDLRNVRNAAPYQRDRVQIKPESAAYVIYTSGTTGVSKGVIVEHRNLLHLVMNQAIPFQFSESDIWTMFHSFCFDFSVWEMYGALLYGGSVDVISAEFARDTEAFYAYLLRRKVTVLNQTPGAFYNLASVDRAHGYHLLNLRYVIFGGEALNPNKIAACIKKYPDTDFVNMYGITETTIHVTCKRLTESAAAQNISNIGQPLSGYTCYVVNRFGKQLPSRIPGELLVGGMGVARGYLNRELLTAEKFIRDPYHNCKRLYRSGDLVRSIEGGDLQYLGRIDQQIKIRGHRIEKGEAEHAVLSLPSVTDAYLTSYKIGDDTVLCCYYCANEPLTIQEMQDRLKTLVPEYCIPSYFVYLEKMPLNKNGKIDRKALPDPITSMRKSSMYTAPQSEYETAIADIWKELLNLPRIGVDDNFFEIGGHSLKATMFSSRILNRYGIKIPLSEIFQKPTVRQLAGYMEETAVSCGFERIEKAPEKEFYEATFGQKRFYFLQQLNEGLVAYNMPIAIESDSKLDAGRVRSALTALTARHQSLRISFTDKDNHIYQKVNADCTIDFEYIATDQHVKRERIIGSFVKPFDLSRAPLMRMKVIAAPGEKDVLLFDMHHIISDGITLNILVRDFILLYRGQELEESRLDYTDYSEWQLQKDLSAQKQFWMKLYESRPEPLELVTDYKRPAVKSFRGACLDRRIDAEIKHAVKELCTCYGMTEFMFYSAAMAILLGRYSGQDDIIIGTSVSGRRNEQLDHVAGLFINTLPLRYGPKENLNLREYLDRTREMCLQALESQDYPLERILEDCGIFGEPSRNPLFDVMFVLQNQNELREDFFSEFHHVINETAVSKMDMTFVLDDLEDAYLFTIEYCTDLYTEHTINQMSEHYVELIRFILKCPQSKLKDIEMISTEEKSLVQYEFNRSYQKLDYVTSVMDVFEEQVRKTPDYTALMFGDRTMTYRELNELANRMAHSIRDAGVKQGQVVGIIQQRSFELIVSIFAVLKAGCGYLPIDFRYPAMRIRNILEISEVALVITDESMKDRMGELKTYLVLWADQVNSKNILNPQRELKPEDAAYLIFTSGTTSDPKCVEITNRNIRSFLEYYWDEVSERNACYLLKTADTFDVSVTELFGWFRHGSRLAILDQNGEGDPWLIMKAIERYQVTHVNFVPSMLQVFLTEAGKTPDRIQSLKYLISAGEPLFYDMAERCYNINRKLTLYNAYGPSETTVYCTLYKVNCDKRYGFRIPAGPVFSTAKIFILDENRNLCGIGVPGELYIGGDGVAKGYKNNQELTEKKFIYDFRYEEGRLYKSGDIGFFRPDGMIEILGRKDDQVKVRGFRIELEEIAEALKNIEFVSDAAVIIRSVQNENQIFAYYVSSREYPYEEIVRLLREALPEYMLPSRIMRLEQIPMNQNQKLDKKALPDIIFEQSKAETGQPRNETERQIAEIFKQVLGISGVDRRAQFLSLGGNSLKMITLVNMLNHQFQTDLKISEIYDHTTVAELALRLKDKKKMAQRKIRKAEQRTCYPVTDEQLDMFLAYEIYPDSMNYNMPAAFRVHGDLDLERFGRCIRTIVERNEILRTRFMRVGEGIVSIIMDPDDFKVESIWSDLDEREELVRFIRPFQLEAEFLMRVRFVRSLNKAALILFDMHHIIMDGVSIGMMLRDIFALYRGEILPEPGLQFKDYAVWREQYEVSEEKLFWNQMIDSTVSLLNLPTVKERGTHVSVKGASIQVEVDSQTSRRIGGFCQNCHCTLFQFLFSLFGAALSKASGNTDVVLGAVTAGRNHIQLKDMYGMFVKTLPVRIEVDRRQSFTEYLEQNKKVILQVFENDNYSFQNILKDSGAITRPGHHPLFDVAMVVQNEDLSADICSNITFEEIQAEQSAVKYDLFLEVTEQQDIIMLKFEYAAELFDRSYMDSFSAVLMNMLQKVLDQNEVLMEELMENQADADNFTAVEDIAFDFS